MRERWKRFHAVIHAAAKAKLDHFEAGDYTNHFLLGAAVFTLIVLFGIMYGIITGKC